MSPELLVGRGVGAVTAVDQLAVLDAPMLRKLGPREFASLFSPLRFAALTRIEPVPARQVLPLKIARNPRRIGFRRPERRRHQQDRSANWKAFHGMGPFLKVWGAKADRRPRRQFGCKTDAGRTPRSGGGAWRGGSGSELPVPPRDQHAGDHRDKLPRMPTMWGATWP